MSVERQVRQGSLSESGGAVKQSRCGSEDDVPVPRKMNSISFVAVPFVDIFRAQAADGVEMEGERKDKEERRHH